MVNKLIGILVKLMDGIDAQTKARADGESVEDDLDELMEGNGM